MSAVAASKRSRILATNIGAVLFVLVFSGCAHRHHAPIPAPRHVYETGPPPWAPAHGHRRKQPGSVELVFDTHLGVYVVVGHEDHYFYEDHYYRYLEGVWQVSVAIDGPWGVAKPGQLPPGLRKHRAKKHDGKRWGPRHGPPASLP